MTKEKVGHGLGRAVAVAAALAAVLGGGAAKAWAYQIHQDRLNCPKGTTLLRIEANPRVCQAQPKRGIPASVGRRACCTIDRDPTKTRCLPFPGCPAASPL